MRVRKLILFFALAFVSLGFSGDQLRVVKIAEDSFHYEVPGAVTGALSEPSSRAFGQTIVAAYQVGLNRPVGALNIGWATSVDGGKTWQMGAVPGIVKIAGGAYDTAFDPVVAHDGARGRWIISFNVARIGSKGFETAVMMSRSRDGLQWELPVRVSHNPDPGLVQDKNWVQCDDHPGSPYYGNCYAQWLEMPFQAEGKWKSYLSTSVDGGATWAEKIPLADASVAYDGQILIQPSGRVIVPDFVFASDDGEEQHGTYGAFVSGDGGKSWSAPVRIAEFVRHEAAHAKVNNAQKIAAATMASDGTVYLVWIGCTEDPTCSGADLQFSKSSDGVHWTKPERIPTTATPGEWEHLVPAIAADPSTEGSHTHLIIAFYSIQNPLCPPESCEMQAEYILSQDAGAHWDVPVQVSEPMRLSSFLQTRKGAMLGDYISVSFVNGKAFPMYPLANPSVDGRIDQPLFTIDGGVTYK